jgi:hypothetical protein
MTEEQLQLLRSLRPLGQDDHEAGVSEARAAAERAGVSIHLDDERQTDITLRAALAQIEPPVGLEDALRTAMRAARGIGEPPVELRESVLSAVRLPKTAKVISDPRLTRRRLFGWGAGIAASLAVGGKWWWDTRAFTVRKLTLELTAITRKGISLTLMSMDKVAVGDWLKSNNAPRIDVLPEKLDALGRKGCHLYDIAGHPVSLECFLLPDMKQLHLFCTPSSGLVNPPRAGAAAEFTNDGDLTLAIWAKGGKTVLLVSHESVELVRTLIA